MPGFSDHQNNSSLKYHLLAGLFTTILALKAANFQCTKQRKRRCFKEQEPWTSLTSFYGGEKHIRAHGMNMLCVNRL